MLRGLRTFDKIEDDARQVCHTPCGGVGEEKIAGGRGAHLFGAAMADQSIGIAVNKDVNKVAAHYIFQTVNEIGGINARRHLAKLSLVSLFIDDSGNIRV